MALLLLSGLVTPASAASTADLTWTVPLGVEVVQLTIVGASGGNTSSRTGGSGGKVTSSFLVNPGDAIRIGLGAPGANDTAGGAGGLNGLSTDSGGSGGQLTTFRGAGGGGSSTVDIDPVGPASGFLTVAVASGGGGAGGGGYGGEGGSAGAITSEGGRGESGYSFDDSPPGSSNPGGAGATISGGGAGGGLATAGSLGNGGAGARGGYAGGGGGGAGRYGGGGGASDTRFNPVTEVQGGGGGGAGSSWVTSDALFVDSTIAEPQYFPDRTTRSGIDWIAFDTTSLPTGTVGISYTSNIDATFGASTQATDFSISPALPAGLTLSSSTGVISGTPTTATNSNFSVSAATKDISGKVVARSTASLNLRVDAALPGAPTIGTATAGDTSATITFTPPVNTGGSAITSYVVTSSPGGSTGTGPTSPITVPGLTNGTSYTFTVTATNSVGIGSASSASAAAVPKGSQTITFTNPGAQNLGTTPTLSAIASSGLSVAFASATTGVCTITGGGAMTFITAGACIINADQTGNASFLAAPQVIRSFTVNAAPTPDPGSGSNLPAPIYSSEIAPHLQIVGKDSSTIQVGELLLRSPITVANSGSFAQYRTSPNLPQGLTLNNSGQITGTPLLLSPKTRYIMRAANSAGTSEISFYLQVDNAAITEKLFVMKVIVVGFRGNSLTPMGPGLQEARQLLDKGGVAIRIRGFAGTGLKQSPARKITQQRVGQVQESLAADIVNSRGLGKLVNPLCKGWKNNCTVVVIRAIAD